MADFNIALPITLKFEGGYVNDPVDPGGETNLGITMKTFSTTAHPLLGIDPTSQNLKNLTQAQAGIIYKKIYWDRVMGDSLPHQPLANIVFDFYVNSGTNASVLLQRILNSMDVDPQLIEDGKIGQATLNALQAVSCDDAYMRYKQGRAAYYESLVKAKPTLGKFIKGWLNRVNAFPDLPVAAPVATPVASNSKPVAK